MNITKLKPIKLSLLFLSIALCLFSCKKDTTDKTMDRTPTALLGVYTLCEGPFGATNNSSITYYDIVAKTSIKDFFKRQNGIDLGSNANDLKQYGSKMYCVITGTTTANKDSYVEVMDIPSGKSIKRIAFSDATSGFMPRYIQFYKDKAYVSSYDGHITKIDTASLVIESRLKVGEALEELAVVNSKLYVTNSNHPTYTVGNNSSVAVVELNTFAKLNDIVTRFNPSRISPVNTGDLFVFSKGDYNLITPSVGRISSVSDKHIAASDINIDYLKFSGGRGFVFGPWDDPYIKTFDAATGLPGREFITDGTTITSPYAVTVDGFSANIFISDANNYGLEGKVAVYNTAGKQQYSFATGAVPQTVVFNYSYK